MGDNPILAGCRRSYLELGRGEIAEAGVWSGLVVVTTPLADRDSGVEAVTEPFEAETLVSELAVEAVSKGILGRLDRWNEVQSY